MVYISFVLFLILVTVPRNALAAEENDTINYAALFGSSPRNNLPFPQLAQHDGYQVENHTIITSDGYILDMFRLPVNNSCPKKVPVIFMHGLFLSGDDCIIPGPGKAHCYIYSEACYDVWVPNVRGTTRYGRRHVSLNPDKDPQFWNFAFDEMALIDMPAFIDYVLNKTGSHQVAFVGHSQGATLLLILCAKKPQYNEKIKVGVGLSATSWLEHARFIITRLQALAAVLLDGFQKATYFEFLPYGGVSQKTGNALCGITSLTYPLCSVAIFALLGYNKFQITDESLKVIVSHQPGGTSFKNMIRWGQMRNNGFSEIDYGIIKNLQKYGKIKPPLIDLSPITMPWYFLGSKNDYVSDIRDLDTLVNHLNTSVSKCILPDETFGHLDFVYGKDIPNYITPKVLSVLKGESFDCS